MNKRDFLTKAGLVALGAFSLKANAENIGINDLSVSSTYKQVGDPGQSNVDKFKTFQDILDYDCEFKKQETISITSNEYGKLPENDSIDTMIYYLQKTKLQQAFYNINQTFSVASNSVYTFTEYYSIH